MEVSPGIGLQNAIELSRQENAEKAAEERSKELAGLSAAVASLRAPEQVLPGVGVIMQGLAAMPMPGVHRPVEFDPEINTKLLSKVAIFQEQQQAQVFAQNFEEKQRGDQAQRAVYESEVKAAAEKTLETEETEQEGTPGRGGFLEGLLRALSERFGQMGTQRLSNGDGGSVLWKTRQDEGGETVLHQVLSSIRGASS